MCIYTLKTYIRAWLRCDTTDTHTHTLTLTHSHKYIYKTRNVLYIIYRVYMYSVASATRLVRVPPSCAAE